MLHYFMSRVAVLQGSQVSTPLRESLGCSANSSPSVSLFACWLMLSRNCCRGRVGKERAPIVDPSLDPEFLKVLSQAVRQDERGGDMTRRFLECEILGMASVLKTKGVSQGTLMATAEVFFIFYCPSQTSLIPCLSGDLAGLKKHPLALSCPLGTGFTPGALSCAQGPANFGSML